VGILDILIRVFVWGIFLAFSWIPGIMVGVLLEMTIGRWAYWPGFLLGVAIFLIYIAENFYGGSPKNKSSPSPFAAARRVRAVKRYLSPKK
jgi:membrane protein implicated in regulation of membrane protease activity